LTHRFAPCRRWIWVSVALSYYSDVLRCSSQSVSMKEETLTGGSDQ
jgi:hypothetical protein